MHRLHCVCNDCAKLLLLCLNEERGNETTAEDFGHRRPDVRLVVTVGGYTTVCEGEVMFFLVIICATLLSYHAKTRLEAALVLLLFLVTS